MCVFFVFFLNVNNDHFVPNICIYLTTICQQSTGTKEVLTIYWTENNSSLCKYIFNQYYIYSFWIQVMCNIRSLKALLVLLLRFGYCGTGHFKRLLVPCCCWDVQVNEITVRHEYAFFFLRCDNGIFHEIKTRKVLTAPDMARCSLITSQMSQHCLTCNSLPRCLSSGCALILKGKTLQFSVE